jgi:GNAT superfamily N-acetyltransferase
MTEFENKYRIVSCAENREKIDEIDEKSHILWPEFMLHDPVANNNWHRLYEDFAEYQFVIIDKSTDTAICQINTVPFRWDDKIEDLPDEGWDWVFLKSIKDFVDGTKPNIISLLQIAILPEYRGKGISPETISYVKSFAKEMRFKNLVAPVRPNLKHLYPLTDIGDYIKWTKEGNLPVDPWLRTHVRGGAQIVKPCRQAMTISGSVEEWESWTKMKFHQSGEYVIPMALNPVSFNIEKNKAVYIEPNVWLSYYLSSDLVESD